MVLVPLVTIGCSEGGIDKEEFIEQADEICRDIESQTKELGTPTDQRSFNRLVDEAAQITEDALVRLRALEPPAGDEDIIDDLLDTIDKATALLPAIRDAGLAQDAKRMSEIGQELQEASDRAREIADDYGFSDCGAEVAPTE